MAKKADLHEISHEHSILGINFLFNRNLVALLLEVLSSFKLGISGGTLSWWAAWPVAAVVFPAGRMLLELSRAANNFIVNTWVVPVETSEVVAPFSESGILKSITIAVLTWILR